MAEKKACTFIKVESTNEKERCDFVIGEIPTDIPIEELRESIWQKFIDGTYRLTQWARYYHKKLGVLNPKKIPMEHQELIRRVITFSHNKIA